MCWVEPIHVAAWVVVLVFSLVPMGLVVVGIGRAVGHGWGAKAVSGAGAGAWTFQGGDVALFLSSLGWALGVGVLATVLGLPGGWVLSKWSDGKRRGGGGVWWWSLVVLPLVLPNYIAYAGWGVLRGPRTPLYDWLEWLSTHGYPLAPVLAGRVLAAISLAVWGSAIASLVLRSGLARVSGGVLEQLAVDGGAGGSVDGAGRGRLWARMVAAIGRARVVARLAFPGVLMSVGVVSLVMLGSAVPFHLADVPTYAIKVWFELTTNPGGADGWIAAWPTMLIAAVCAGVAAWRLHLDGSDGAPDADLDGNVCTHPCLKWAKFGVVGVVLVGVVGPMVLLVGDMKSYSPIVSVAKANAREIGQTLTISAWVGVCLVLVCTASWVVGDDRRRGAAWLRAVVTFVMLVLGLVPGVLVGAAMRRGADLLGDRVMESDAMIVLAHVARFGFVAMLVGEALRRTEAKELRALRRLEREGGTLAAWWGASFRPAIGVLIGVGLLGSVLSGHEIETTILVQPSAGSGGLAHVVLGYLHFQRMDDLAASAVHIVGASLALGAAASVLVGWSWRERTMARARQAP